MVSRKSHPKSRNGCPECKKRRIKCDEVKPRCSNCVKHDIECSFAADPSTLEDHRASKKRRASDDSRRGSDDTITKSKTPRTNGHPKAYEEPPRALQMEELELLHHFTTETCMTLSDRAQSHHLWRLTVPQIAFQHEFLMRSILAISALHLSYLKPHKCEYYTQVAVQQQDAALRQFRPIMENIGSVDESQCDAFLGMSSLLVVYGFETQKSSATLGWFSHDREQSDKWLPLIRGVNLIIMSVWNQIRNGRLAGLLHDHEQQPPSTDIPDPLEEQLGKLEDQSMKEADNEYDGQACKEAVVLLRQCFIRIYNKTDYECEVSLAFLWPVLIPQHFINMVQDGKSLALIILAHYCTVLHHLDAYWWLKGRGRSIVDNIKAQLDPGLHDQIEWAIRVVRPLDGASGPFPPPSLAEASISPTLKAKPQQQLATLDDDLGHISDNKLPRA